MSLFDNLFFIFGRGGGILLLKKQVEKREKPLDVNRQIWEENIIAKENGGEKDFDYDF